MKNLFLSLLFVLLCFSCDKTECDPPKCEKQYGLVTYWLRTTVTSDTIHLTNIGYKDCDGSYWKLSEPTIALIGQDRLVDTSYAHHLYFNFVRFKPFR